MSLRFRNDYLRKHRPSAFREQYQKLSHETVSNQEFVKGIVIRIYQYAGQRCVGASGLYSTAQVMSNISGNPADARAYNTLNNPPSLDVPLSLAAFNNIRTQIEAMRDPIDESFEFDSSKCGREINCIWGVMDKLGRRFADLIDCKEVDNAMQLGGSRKF